MDQTSDLWIDIEIDGEQISPPIVTREPVLPLQSLSWENFERLCYRLALRGSDLVDCRRYGTRGQEQQGIDLYVRRASDGRYVTWQCKRYQEFTTRNIEHAVGMFLDGEWAARSQTFHLAVSASLVQTRFAEAVESEAQKCRARQIEFVPLDLDRLSEMLKAHPDLVDDFFGRPWVEAFCGRDAAMRLSGRKLNREERLKARRMLRELYTTHFATVDIGLPATTNRFRGAAHPLPLHDRYVIPMVEARTAVLELTDESRPSAATDQTPSNGEGAGRTQVARGPFALTEQRTQLDLFVWLESADRAVLLGGPGLGKSASLRFGAVDLLLDQPRSEGLARKWGAYLPLFLPFAFLTRVVAESEVVGIPDCFRAWLQKLSARPEEIALLEEALEDDRLLLLLDGLDEWSNATSAQTALAQVQAFVDLRHLPVIASARPLGYERLGSLGAEWKHAELLPFAEDQQRQFAFRWFEHFLASASPDGAPTHRDLTAEQETNSLMQELEGEPAVAELAGVPLLLSALICLRMEGRVLPQNRFEVIGAIANTLIADQPRRRATSSLQGSDTSRGGRLVVEMGIELLAFSVHQQPGSDAISEELALEVLADFYEGDAFRKSPGEALEIAKELIDQAAQNIGILVERQHREVGFLHRSLQEYLAAKRLMRLSFPALKAFVGEKLGHSSWQETLLTVLHLLERDHEVDELLRLIREAELEPLTEPMRKILLARAICGKLNCSASIADEITDNLFATIEATPWMPLRSILVSAVARGIDSERVGDRIRQKLRRWFPGRTPWRWGLFAPLAEKPVTDTGRRLIVALFNCSSDIERKEIAEAIATGVAQWPELFEQLRSIATEAAEAELIAAVLHALALGWPADGIITELLHQASESANKDLRCAAFIHRARLGDTSPVVRQGVVAFCAYGAHPYPWEAEIVNVLTLCWPRDEEFRNEALSAARRPVVVSGWDPRMAQSYLFKAYPGDDDVAEIIAESLRRQEHFRTLFARAEGWEEIRAGFAAHPTIVPVAEQWLETHYKDEINEVEVARVAMLGRSARCKALLIEKLKEGRGLPIWPVSALIEIAGTNDLEVHEAVSPYLANEQQAGWLGEFLPDFIQDRETCRNRLLQLLETGIGYAVNHLLAGLHRLGALNQQDVLRVIDRRLDADADRHFWRNARYMLIRNLPQHPSVRRQALLDLNDEDPALSVMALSYADDPEFRRQLETLLEPLQHDLRLAIVRELRGFALRTDDAFARNLLGEYATEWHAETRTAAAYAYYTAERKLSADPTVHLDRLKQEFTTGGLGGDERRQSAAAGLLALGRPDVMQEAMVNGERRLPPVPLSDMGLNGELTGVLVREWDQLRNVCGEGAWRMFHSWDVLVYQLAALGKRGPALLVPKDLQESAYERAHFDVGCFRALTVLDEGTQTLRNLCLQFFSRFRIDEHVRQISFGYQDVEVIIEAAHYFAEHHGDDPNCEQQLEEIAQSATEATGPMIALCCGWPQSKFLQMVWNSIRSGRSNGRPATAWLVSTQANPQEFTDYALSLPDTLRSNWLNFPVETLAAARQRLSRDAGAQQLMLETMKASINPDQQAAAARLLGVASQQHETLREWANGQIRQLRSQKAIHRMSYDIFRGRARPLEFCLLEACLTR